MTELYQAFYCEENVWHLADRMRDRARTVVFISNAERTCALWQQRAAPAGLPVVWDYHVVLGAGGLVYDLDSRLGSPIAIDDWIAGTFPIPLPDALAPRFRVIDGDRFLEVFASDRSHMRSGEGWRALPPPWPPIGQGMNLMRFVDMESEFEGRVVELSGLRLALTRPPPGAAPASC